MNCIWITTDSFRQDHIHCYRPEGTIDETGPSLQVRTPSFDRLAAEATMFDRMRPESLPTIPCRRAVFTGRRTFPWADEPRYKGIYNGLPGWRPIPQDDVTVAEHLSEHGYVTAMVADVYHIMKPSMNFHRGFQSFHWERGQEYDQWQSHPLPDGLLEQHLKPGIDLSAARTRVLTQYLRNHLYLSGDDDYPSARTFRHAIEWLERNRAHDRFFLYIDTFDPHEPWLMPQRFLDMYVTDYDGPQLICGNPYQRAQLTDAEHRYLRCRYAAVCTMIDHWVGRLLDTVDRLGLHEDTLIVLMSDHGKIIGEFGHYGMPAQDLGPVLARVPCFVRHPGGENAGKRVKGWLYNTDLVATMLSLLDVPPKPGADGDDIWPALSADVDTLRDHLVTAYGSMVAAWQDDWLYLANAENGRGALYNLAEDIHRKHDVAERYPDVRNELAMKIAAVVGQ